MKKKAGRPPISKSLRLSKKVTIGLNKSQESFLRKLASKHKLVSLSQALKHILQVTIDAK